jgi:hypothetical protein
MKTNTNMCVFNKFTDKNKNIVFKKHLIDHVFWDDSKAINLNRGYDNADDVNVFIPKDQNNMSSYVDPKQYNSLNKWTLQVGDFIVKGNVKEKEVSGIKELTTKYDNVFTISLVDDKDFGSSSMHHFEIRGK